MSVPRSEHDKISLQSPPIYRRMLAADDPLQVTQPALLVTLIASVIAAVIGETWYVHHFGKPLDLLGVAVRTVFILANSLLIARFVARWFGSKAALTAAIVFCSTLSVVLGLAGNLQTLCLIALMYCFARQGVTARVPLDESAKTWRICWGLLAFFIIGFGYRSAIPVVATWIIFALVTQDSQLLKRIFAPLGLAILGLAVGTSLWLEIPAVPKDDSFFRIIAPTMQLSAKDFTVLLLPWWPMLAWAIYIGLRNGYYAMPWFQLIAVWLTVTALAVVLGLMDSANVLPMLTPPLAIAVAPPLAQIFRLAARRR